MGYRATYSVNIDWIGPGEGPMGGGLVGAGVTTIQGPSSGGPLPQGGRGGAQTFEFSNNPMAAGLSIAGSGTAGALATGDIAAWVTSIAADFTAQITAAQPRLAGFATGGG